MEKVLEDIEFNEDYSQPYCLYVGKDNAMYAIAQNWSKAYLYVLTRSLEEIENTPELKFKVLDYRFGTDYHNSLTVQIDDVFIESSFIKKVACFKPTGCLLNRQLPADKTEYLETFAEVVKHLEEYMTNNDDHQIDGVGGQWELAQDLADKYFDDGYDIDWHKLQQSEDADWFDYLGGFVASNIND